MEETPQTPRSGLPPLLIEAVSYVEDRHWEVAQGCWLIEGDGPARCSCGDPRCELPGAHPTGPEWRRKASAGPGIVRKWWTENPEGSILLPTGRFFDVLDVPEMAGCLALARMERLSLQLGPVVSTPATTGTTGRRLLFLVLPGVVAKLPEMLRRLGWAPGRLDMVARGEGDWIVGPSSRVGLFSSARWARPPSEMNRWLPDAQDLISPLAYACGREAAPLRPQGAPATAGR
ncbi:bifunctional DNA primase/polymerase [Kitasatospora sp. NPDC051853]|uniref:bifunctional DNA primase/polymerase n=1 Tax=Kitasatospora sp. NPDC051853 TaxID=3364058 RepID=UPI00378E879E